MRNTELEKITSLFLGSKEEQEKKKKKTITSSISMKYQQYLETGEFFNLEFQKVDANGNLFTVEDDITIQMKADEINGRLYNLRFKSQKLEETYCVKVINIDEKSKTVFVSQYEACLDKKPEIEAELDRLLEQRGTVTVKAKILRIQSNNTNGVYSDTGVWIDLCGVGLLGYVYIGDWNPTYTQALYGKVSHGDVVEVIVKEKRKRESKHLTSTEVSYYICSRKELQQNPWEDQSLQEKYHVGDLVRIKCLSTQPQFWFGEVSGLTHIQILVEYPSARHTFRIIPGMEYMGKIYKIDLQEHLLKARVFKALTLDAFLEEDTNKKGED